MGRGDWAKGGRECATHCTGAVPVGRRYPRRAPMPDDDRWQEPDGPSRALRWVGRAVVLAVVLAAAGLLGRLGSGVGDGPALEVEQSAPASGEGDPGPDARGDAGGVDGEGGVDGGAGEGQRRGEDAWALLPDPALAARDAHTAVWTGRAVLVWGGHGPFGSGDSRHVDGVALDVAQRAWAPIPAAPLDGIVNHTAVWTGPTAAAASPVSWSHAGGHPQPGEMIVWSGAAPGDRGDRGAAFDPVAQQWRVLAPDPLPARQYHTAVWTGPLDDRPGEMLVWGGSGAGDGPDGAAYEPLADAWRALPDPPTPTSTTGFTATWTGREMVVLGGTGRDADPPAATAQAYDPVADAWRVLPEPPGGVREAHTAVWTGRELLVWGGVGRGGLLARPVGLAYDPAADAWTALPEPPGGARVDHAAVWAGDAMVVWGGTAFGHLAPAGIAYDPVERSSRALPDPPADPRVPARLVWTGRELVVLDGRSLSRGLTYQWPSPSG